MKTNVIIRRNGDVLLRSDRTRIGNVSNGGKGTWYGSDYRGNLFSARSRNVLCQLIADYYFDLMAQRAREVTASARYRK